MPAFTQAELDLLTLTTTGRWRRARRRRNRTDSFCLQESVTVTSRKLRKKRSGLRSVVVPDALSSQMVKPLRTWRFYPGNESATVQPELTRVDG